MIVKFDHIAYSCSKTELATVVPSFKDYSVAFSDEVANLELKKELMHYYIDNHKLIFLEPCSPEKLPIEITCYETVSSNAKTAIEYDFGHTLKIRTPDINHSSELLEALGFKFKNEHFEYSSLFPPKTVKIELIKEPVKVDWSLDNHGYCCLAFMSNNAYKEHEKLSKQFRCTEVDTLIVNGKQLNLFFVKGSCGELIEIFSIDRK